MNGYSNNRRNQNYFSGGQDELQEIKNKETLQKFVRRNRAKKSFYKLTYIIIFLILTTLFTVICLSVFFKIKEVEIVGTSRYTKEEILLYCGIEPGQSLYEVGNGDVAGLSDRFSFIKSAKVTRKLPYTLIITIVENESCYYTNLYGDYYIMSKDLRILGSVTDKTLLEGEGLVELMLPEADRCILGETFVFANESDEKYVKLYLGVLYKSVLFTGANAFDLRDKFELKLIYDSIYLILLADGDELATKLSATAQMLTKEYFNDRIPARLDVANPSEISVTKNHNINITFD